MITRSKYIEIIVEKIRTIMENTPNDYNNDSNLEDIKNALNREFPNHHCIAVLIGNKPNRKNQIYGARMYPTQNEMDVISKEILNTYAKTNYTLKEYIIELDYTFLYNRTLGVTPEEMTAVIIHEVGHAQHFSHEIANAKIKLINAQAATVGVGLGVTAMVTGLINLPVALVGIIVLNMCQSCIEKSRAMDSEILADSLAIEYGASEELKDVLNKTYRMMDGPALSDNALYQWIINLRTGRNVRLNELENSLNKEMRDTNSPIMKGYLSNILIKYKRQKNSIKTSFIAEAENLLTESIQSFTEMITKGHSMLEIEEIRVEIQRMTSYEDKMYIVTRIAKDRNRAELTLEKLDKHESSKRQKIKEFIKDLDDLLALTRKSNPERQYGIFIKAPQGYEG